MDKETKRAEEAARTIERLRNLPERDEDWIITQYANLIEALQQPEIVAMEKTDRYFAMLKQFPELAETYNQLFAMACVSRHIPLDHFSQIVKVVHDARRGIKTQDDAHRLSIELAKAHHSNQQNSPKPANV